MASPFPGMDPYLESPVLWPGVHQGLIGNLRALLNTLLPPAYIADIGERIYVTASDRSIYPGISLFERAEPHTMRPSAGPVVQAVADPPPVLIVEPTEVREAFIELRPVGDETRVVTVIGVLSYANKTRGSEGRDLYLTKQQEILRSATHVIEIDLLRRGEPTVAAPYADLRRRGPWDYLVSLHRGTAPNRFETWPRTVRERLPRMLVPLEGDLPDVVVDLQAAFDRNYEEGAYARRVDYRQEPPLPLADADAAWADELLRARGLRG